MEKYMKQFINDRLAGQFKKSIPELKKQIGEKPLHSDDATWGVAGNTFRAYRGWIKPIEAYKSWAKNITTSLKSQPL